MSAESTGEPAFGAFELFNPLVDSYTPFYRKLASMQGLEAEDIKQEILLKLLKRFKTIADWQQVEDKKAYLKTTARHVASTLRSHLLVNHDSLDDEKNIKLKNNLSDEEASCSRIKKELDRAPYYEQINKMLEEFSKYERLLIHLNIKERCRPALIAVLLVTEYATIFEDVYGAKMLPGDDEAKLKQVKKIVQNDCNAACAKFRQRLKKHLTRNGENHK